jgi:hypothetical protein
MLMEKSGSGHQAKFSTIVAKAWSDPAFKARLLADPKAVLEAEGVTIATKVQVVENTSALSYFVLPEAPSKADLADHDVAKVFGKLGCGVCCDLARTLTHHD